jgi:hypothetical protein
MKLAIYSKDGAFSTVYENINNPVWVRNEIICTNGTFSGITDKHILLGDDVTPPETLAEAILLDQKDSINKVLTVEEENEQLKARVSELEDALLFLMSM